MTAAPTWAAPLATGPIDARVRVPGSKSLTNRWLVLALLAEGTSVLRHPLRSDDSERMVGALRALGAQVDDEDPAAWVVRPPSGRPRDSGPPVPCCAAIILTWASSTAFDISSIPRHYRAVASAGARRVRYGTSLG